MSHLIKRSLVLSLAAVFVVASTSSAVTVTRTRTVNAEHNSGDMESPFFTASPDNTVAFGTTSTGFFAVGPAQAGQISSTMTRGTVSVAGNSTSAGVDLTPGTADDWLDGNGIPAGLTLSFDVALDISITATSPVGSLMTNPGLSGTTLGDGIGISQSAGTTGVMDVGEGLAFTAPIISNVSYAGTLTEPGFTFDGGDVEDFGIRNFRSRDLAESPTPPAIPEGALLTDAEGTIGFGATTGTIASNVTMENNFTTASSFFPRRTGAFTLEPTVGSFSLKGLGFQYEAVYDISPSAAVDNADFDGDGFVDGADLMIWQRNVDLASGATQGQGNANPGVDGAVDGADLAIWQSQYGTSQPAIDAAAAVPEPSAWIVALGFGVVAAGARRIRR